MTEPTKQLVWYQQDAPFTHVLYRWEYVVPDVGVIAGTNTVLDADLIAHAAADGRDTWDQSDLAAVCGLTLP